MYSITILDIEIIIGISCLCIIIFLVWYNRSFLERKWWNTEGWLETSIDNHRWVWFFGGISMLIGAILLSGLRLACIEPQGHFLNSLLEFISFGLGLVITFGGFILAIMALRQIIDRPITLEEVLFKANIMIQHKIKTHKPNPGNKKDFFLSIYTEYPVNGAMSLQDSPAYKTYFQTLIECTDAQSHFFMDIIVPKNWRDKIDQYAKIYGLEKEKEEAKTYNNRFLVKTSSCRDLPNKSIKSKAIYCNVRQTKNDNFPKYQAIIIGENNKRKGQEGVIQNPTEGIIFFAIESAFPKPQGNGSGNKDVNILAWKTHDSKILQEVIEFFNSLELEPMPEVQE